MWHVWEQDRSIQGFGGERPVRKDHLEDLDLDRRVVLK
jgi:hypothetical protein